MTPHHRTTSTVLAVAIAFLVLLAACGGDDSADVVDKSSSTTTGDGGEPRAGGGERSSDTTTTDAEGTDPTTDAEGTDPTAGSEGPGTTTGSGDPTTTTEGGAGAGAGPTSTTPADDGGEPVAGSNAEVDTEEEAETVDWARQADEYRGQNGRRVGFDCPPDGEPEAIWGNGTYTDDSSVCTAAVHDGLISMAEGGRIVVEIAPGQASYGGTESNGVSSISYGPWEGSFTFPGD